jgi:hypothetical protein
LEEQGLQPRRPILRPWTFSPFFADELRERPGTEEQKQLASQLHELGFVVIENLVTESFADAMVAQVEPLFDDVTAIEQRRVQDAWQRGCDTVRELALQPRIQALLHYLYGRRPIPFQTLNFKWGTEQRGHADAIHFSCIPQGFMCGVWVALEDTDSDNGPLFYYPGSHALPELNLYDLNQTVETMDYGRYEDTQEELMNALGLERVEFHAKKGDALLWSSNIVHGGGPVKDQARTRWSQVTHYYFEGGIYYTPVYSDFVSGELLLKDITDLVTMRPVEHTYNGAPITITPLANGRSRIAYGACSEVATSTEVDKHVAALQAQIRERDVRIDELLNSTTWKIGRAVVEPLSRLRGVWRKRIHRS